jgi:hypothetical protein
VYLLDFDVCILKKYMVKEAISPFKKISSGSIARRDLIPALKG